MSMFGSVNEETIKHLEFALHSVVSELGNPLEPQDPVLKKSEKSLVTLIHDLKTYSKKVNNRV